MPEQPTPHDLPAIGGLPLGDDDRRRLDFLVAAHALTGVQRLNRVLDGSRGETSAEHSWHLALTAVALAHHAAAEVRDRLDEVLQMLVVHDIVEVDTGDVPYYDTAARLAIVEAEERAAARLFGLLPAEEAQRLHALWHEFEAAETPVARFARALDRLQPILVHWAGGGAVWRERGATVAHELAVVADVEAFCPELGPLARALVDDATRAGMLTG